MTRDAYDDTAIFMRPRRRAYMLIADANRRVAPLPKASCASAHIHALGVCASKLALANWLDSVPFPLLEVAILKLQSAVRVHVENEPCRAMMDSETFLCHVCSQQMPAAYRDTHIAMHTCEMDSVALSNPYRTGYDPGEYMPLLTTSPLPS
jgi:hypothetical protein